jgi:hypothetical protein
MNSVTPCRGFRDDRIAVGAQASHSGGSAINQRECAGLNWPPPSIPAEEPVSISPEAVRRAGPFAKATTSLSVTCTFRPSSVCPVALVPSGAVWPPLGVVGEGHPDEPQSLSDMRRADARSAKIVRPEGVARSFQVSRYKVEPIKAVLACNLLAKDEGRAQGFDEVEEGGP